MSDIAALAAHARDLALRNRELIKRSRALAHGVKHRLIGQRAFRRLSVTERVH